MGLSKSKLKPGKGAERKRGRGLSPLALSPDRRSQGSDSAAARREEKADRKVKSNKKKLVIPKIVVTRASQETLLSYNSSTHDEQKTIKEEAGWGPYYRHRDPSTVAAYDAHAQE